KRARSLHGEMQCECALDSGNFAGMPIPQAASAMAELRCLKTAPLLGPAPRRSALRENRRLARAEAVEAAVSATRLHIRRRHACRYKENSRLTGAEIAMILVLTRWHRCSYRFTIYLSINDLNNTISQVPNRY